MSLEDKLLFCYSDDAEDDLKTINIRPMIFDFEYENAEQFFDYVSNAEWRDKLANLDSFFRGRIHGKYGSFVYDIKYGTRSGDTVYYDILFLPGFATPAEKMSFAIEGDRVALYMWDIYSGIKFSKINPQLYVERFRILKDDYPQVRLSYIEIMKDRLSPAGFEDWIKKAEF